jgi:NTF2 fold immunity protein
MTYRTNIVIMLAMALVAAGSLTAGGPCFDSKKGCVPDAETAVKIAEAVLIPVYGQQQILSERPFKATLDRSTWTVEGSVPCNGPPGAPCPGGAAIVKISKATGRIIHMTHEM